MAVAIVGRAITVWEAIQKRSHEPIYKTYTKIEAKGLRATTLLLQSWKVITKGGAIEKRSHEPIYKTYTKNEAKGQICYRKVGRAITKGGGAKEKSLIQ